MIVRVEVIGDDARPYRPGTAHVYVDGALIAKLRTCEHAEVETTAGYVARVVQPLGLNEAAGCPLGTPGCERTACGPHSGGACYGPNAPQHMDMGR